MKITKILFAAICIASLVAWQCQRHTTEPLPTTISGKALFTGPTPVSKHHGIDVTLYMKYDSALIPVDTTFTDSTGVYFFAEPLKDGDYVLVADFLYYYADTVEVEIKDGRIKEKLCDLHVRQMARVKFTSDKNVYRLTDSFTWTVEVINISDDRIGLPNESWFTDRRWHRLVFAVAKRTELRYFSRLFYHPVHGPPCSGYDPGEIMILTRTAPISSFTDTLGSVISTGNYLFYAATSGCLSLEWNGRILPIFEPAEVEIMP